MTEYIILLLSICMYIPLGHRTTVFVSQQQQQERVELEEAWNQSLHE